MNIHMLASDDMIRSIPPEIEILNDWGWVTIRVGTKDDDPSSIPEIDGGTHIMVNGTVEDISKWIEQFEKVWIGEGHPQMHHFQEVYPQIQNNNTDIKE